MYTNNGYRNNSETDLVNDQVPLQVNSSGISRLITRPSRYTTRPGGRPDYQLIYVASGTAWFTFGEKEEAVTEGHMILMRPGVPQKYVYYAVDRPETYWVHFTGNRAAEYLEKAGFAQKDILYTGHFSEYGEIFLRMIRELQLMRPECDDLLALLLRQLFVLVRRHVTEGFGKKYGIQKEMEQAIHYFNENYDREIGIEAYAREHHMSTCWFIRSFRDYAHLSPLQYITSVRMLRAKELLETTDYTINEIGAMVGYDNPLYFSRIFKKQTGVSPSQYRRTAFTPL